LNIEAETKLDSEQVFDRYRPLINSTLQKYNYRNYGIQYDDLIQEIRIKLWRAFQHDIDIHKISIYVKKVVDSVLIDNINNARKDLYIYRHTELIYSEFHSLELENIIMESVGTLLESRRIVISLYLRGFSVNDIARILKWTKIKTYNLYIRGIRDLRSRLKGQGIKYEFKLRK
jgi:RNA polymerase sigma factor (sigma-70 family)